MPPLFYPLALWLAAMSAVSFLLYGWDKWMAKLDRRRVPERVLLLWAAFGGAAGALCGMALFRHKTRKPRFRVLVPLCLALHLALLAFAFFRP